MTPNNPFAVLRLPANATAPEIKSGGQLALARLRLSDPDNTTAIREIESAIEQLRDPVKRFRFGLEWPSLGPSAAKLLATHPSFSDHSLEGWQARNAAIEQLMEGESPSCKQHIWSVFMLLHAHEAFSSALAPKGQSLYVPPTMEVARVTTLFLNAIKQWCSATSAPQFWMAQRMRAKEINDPRVDADLITSCEREAFAIAVKSFAELASAALRLRNAQICSAIVEGIKFSGANHSNIDGVLSEIYKPMCSRIESAIATLQTKLKSTKSKSDGVYNSLLDEYVRDVQPDIALLLIVGDLPGTTEERCRDSAAQFLRSLSVESANNADAYEVAKKATLLARQVVDSAQIRNTLAADSEQLNTLALASETSKHIAPLNAKLQAALASNNLEDAVAIIDQLIVAAPVHATELRELRQRVSSGLSTNLFNSALAQIRYRNLGEARRLLNSALSHETVPSERMIIQRALATLQTQEQKAGCLVPLALATTGIAVAGGSITAAIVGWNAFIA
jgi:hypothetical protein